MGSPLPGPGYTLSQGLSERWEEGGSRSFPRSFLLWASSPIPLQQVALLPRVQHTLSCEFSQILAWPSYSPIIFGTCHQHRSSLSAEHPAPALMSLLHPLVNRGSLSPSTLPFSQVFPLSLQWGRDSSQGCLLSRPVFWV